MKEAWLPLGFVLNILYVTGLLHVTCVLQFPEERLLVETAPFSDPFGFTDTTRGIQSL